MALRAERRRRFFGVSTNRKVTLYGLYVNLILMQNGYPPAIIRTLDRLKYIGGLDKAQLGGAKDGYHKVIEAAVDRSLDIYLKAAAGEVAEQDPDQVPDLLRIGQLAREAG